MNLFRYIPKKQTNQPSKQSSLIDSSIKEITQNDSFVNNKCTASCFGRERIKQQTFICSYCDPKKTYKFCHYCYYYCHQSCRDSEGETKKTTGLFISKKSMVMYSFVCDCLNLKHVPLIVEKKELVSCQLAPIDSQFLSKQLFFCNEEKQKLCSMCFFICHKECFEKEQYTATEIDINSIRQCDCKDANHTLYNEFTFQIPIFDYQTKIKVKFWPIQMVNMMFETGTIFKSLAILFQKIITSPKKKSFDGEDKSFPSLLEQFSNMFNRKFKTYYYHKEILQMFPFQELVEFMRNFKAKTQQESLVKLRLMFILLFVHFKKDFALIKTYTSIDFMTSSILERLKYRYFIFQKSFYTKYLHEKYNITKNDAGILKIIALEDFCPFMEFGSKMGLLNEVEFQDEMEIGLKFICFMLKKMLFNLNDLKRLITVLYNYHDNFINRINVNDIGNINTWMDLFIGFSEIFFMICVSYNDQVVDEYLTDGEFNHAFIHTKCDHGKLLFQMVIKNSIVITKHYQLIKRGPTSHRKTEKETEELDDDLDEKKKRVNPNGVPFKKPQGKGILFNKIIKLYHETLKIFTLTNNVYYHQLNNLKKSDILQYKAQLSLIEELGNEKEYQNDLTYDLSKTIEDVLQQVFLSSNEDNLKYISQIIFHYDQYIKKINNRIEKYTIKKAKTTDIEWRYIELINLFYSNQLEFLQNKTLKFNHDLLIEQLTFSNIDDISLKVLIFLSTKQYPCIITYELVIKIISVLSLYLYNETGIKYLIMGKTLTRLNKLFNRFSSLSNFKEGLSTTKTDDCTLKDNNKEVLQDDSYTKIFGLIINFLFLLIKGINKYKIDLEGHKVLERFSKNLIKHIKVVYEKSNELKATSKLIYQLNIITKIFNYLTPFYEQKDLMEITDEISNIILHSHYNFFDPERFYSYYDSIETRFIFDGHNIDVNSKQLAESDNEMRKKLILSENINDESNRIMLNSPVFNNNKQHPNDEMPAFKKNKTSLEISLYYSYMKLFLQRSNYIHNTKYDSMIPIIKLFDYKENNQKLIKLLFQKNKLDIKHKLLLLNTMRKVFFINRTSKEHMNNIQGYITGKDYLSYLIINDIKTFPSIFKENKIYTKEETSEINLRYQIIDRIELFVSILINEIEQYNTTLKTENQANKYLYSKEIVYAVKHTAEFFYLERDLWNKPFISFHNLAIQFLKTEEEINIMIKHKGKPPPKYYNKLFRNNTKVLNNFTKKKSIAIKRTKTINGPNKTKEYSFDVFDRDSIFKAVSETVEKVLSRIKTQVSFSLSSFLDTYDTTQELNFTPVSLLEIKDYEYFYEEAKLLAKKKLVDDEIFNMLDEIQSYYVSNFLDLNETNFFAVIQNVTNDNCNTFDHIIKYFRAYLDSYVFDGIYDSLLCLVTKTAFYNTEEIQESFKESKSDDFFFVLINSILQKEIYHCFISCKNIYDNDRFTKITNLTKLTLQFIQLLGEDFCTDFHEAIFQTKNYKDLNKPSIFKNVMNALKHSILCINLSKDIEAELPYDKLIILTSNFIDFITEFLVTKTEFALILEEEIEGLLFQHPKMIDVLGFKCDNNSQIRMKVISYIKVKFIQFIISYIQNGNKNNTIQKLYEHHWGVIELFNEMLYTFQTLIKNCERDTPSKFKKLNDIMNIDSYVEELIVLYVHEEKFRDTLQLRYCFQLFIMIRILETYYGKTELERHFTKMKYEEMSNKGKKTPSKTSQPIDQDENEVNQEKTWTINTDKAVRIYKFMEQLVLKVEIKTKGMIDSSEKEETNKEEETDSLQITFFIRPYMTYFISKQTIINFENNVNRESATTKYIDLMSSTDYFMFEMVVNRNLINENRFNRFFCDFQYNIFEWVNILIIIIHNILLIEKYYKPVSINDTDYNTKIKDFYIYELESLILAIIQLVYIVCVIGIWGKYKFALAYQYNILRETGMTFIFRKKQDCGEKKISKKVNEFFQDTSQKVWDLITDIDQTLSYNKRIYFGLCQAILLNREINILVYTALLLILYFATKSSMFLVIPSLFLANIFQTLFSIFSAVKNKWVTLLTILLFTYLIVYIFMWLSIFFFSDNFILDEVYAGSENNPVDESFCYSSLQCWMFLISYGVRAGGGISDELAKVSYKTNPSYFILRFFFDVFFHIFVVLILLNVFLGIIVDAFAELRNENWQRERDRKNICFICQLSRDACVTKNIDFIEHINKTHYLWNYVYYLADLHLRNVNDFNRINKYVWDKLGNLDYSWIPLEMTKDNEGNE